MRNLAILAITTLATLPSPAGAQTICAPNEAWAKDLRDKFGETPLFTAKMGESKPVVFFVNEETGTFSIILIAPEVSCMIGAGSDFEALPSGEPA